MGGAAEWSRRAFLRAGGATAVGAALAPMVRFQAAGADGNSSPTRVALIVLDDARYDDLQFLPAYRALCNRGVVFMGHRTDTPSCAEARASIFTGYQQYSHGVTIDLVASYYRSCVQGYLSPRGFWMGPWEHQVGAPRSASDNPVATSGQLNNWIRQAVPNTKIGIIGKYQNHYAKPAKLGGVDYTVLDVNGIPLSARRIPPDVDYWAVKVGDDKAKAGKSGKWDGGDQDSYNSWMCRGSNPSSTTDASGALTYTTYAMQIVSLSWSGGVATCVTNVPHTMAVGDAFWVDGCKPLGWNTPPASFGFDGTDWNVSAVVDDFTFQFPLAVNPGTVNVPKLGKVYPSKLFGCNVFLSDALTFLGSCADTDPLFLYYAVDVCHQGESDAVETQRKYINSVNPADFMLRNGVPGNFASTIDTTDPHFQPAHVQWAQRQEGLKTFNDNLVALMDYVDSRGWTDSFVWIVTSDQGVHHGEYGIYVDGGSKYFAKQTAYEPSCRAPLCIAGPGLAPEVVTRPTHHFDLPFTVLDLFGATSHPVHDLRDGVSLLRLLDPTLYPQRAVALNHLIPGTSTVNALVDATNFKFVEAQPLGKRPLFRVPQLYDLTNDPDEATNLATSMPDVVTAMRARAKVLHSARGPAYRNNTA